MKLLVDEIPKNPKDCIFCLENKLNKDPDFYGEREFYHCILRDPEIESRFIWDYEPYYGTGKLEGVKSELSCYGCDIENCPYLKKYNTGTDFLKAIINEKK